MKVTNNKKIIKNRCKLYVSIKQSGLKILWKSSSFLQKPYHVLTIYEFVSPVCNGYIETLEKYITGDW